MAKKYSEAVNPEVLKEIGINGIELTINSRAERSICNCGKVVAKTRDGDLPEICSACGNDLKSISNFWINGDKEIGQDVDKDFYEIFSETDEDGNICIYAKLTYVYVDAIHIKFKRRKNVLLVYNPNLGDCAEAIVKFEMYYGSHDKEKIWTKLIPYIEELGHPALSRLANIVKSVSTLRNNDQFISVNLRKILVLFNYGYLNKGKIFDNFEIINKYSELIAENCNKNNYCYDKEEFVDVAPINSIEDLFEFFNLPYTLRSVFTDQRHDAFRKDYYTSYRNNNWTEFRKIEKYPTEFKGWLAYYVNHSVLNAKAIKKLLELLEPEKDFDYEAVVNFIKKHKYFGDRLIDKLERCIEILTINDIPINSQTLTFKKVSTLSNDSRVESKVGVSEVQMCLFHSHLNGGDVLKALDVIGI